MGVKMAFFDGASGGAIYFIEISPMKFSSLPG